MRLGTHEVEALLRTALPADAEVHADPPVVVENLTTGEATLFLHATVRLRLPAELGVVEVVIHR